MLRAALNGHTDLVEIMVKIYGCSLNDVADVSGVICKIPCFW